MRILNCSLAYFIYITLNTCYSINESFDNIEFHLQNTSFPRWLRSHQNGDTVVQEYSTVDKFQRYYSDQDIHFLFTDESGRVSDVASCAIQSASLMNPRSNIILLSQTKLKLPDIFLNVTLYKNIKNEIVLFEDMLKSTEKLFKWYKENLNEGRKNFKADLSDALRFALLYTRGGAYLDTDMILLKPLSTVHINTIGKQLVSSDKKGKVPFVNGAAMLFEQKNSYISECINDFYDSYDPKKFGSVGPDLLWNTYKRINNSDSFKERLPHLVESSVFYPVKFKSHALKSFFVNKAPDRLPWFKSATIAVHFWSHLSSRFTIEAHSKGGQILSHCSDVYFLNSLVGSKK